MYRLANRNVTVFWPRCRPLPRFSPSPFPIFISSVPSRFLRYVSMQLASLVSKLIIDQICSHPQLCNNLLGYATFLVILWLSQCSSKQICHTYPCGFPSAMHNVPAMRGKCLRFEAFIGCPITGYCPHQGRFLPRGVYSWIDTTTRQ
ncbi:hypothetical protein VNO78_21576 [Psophocarpus tetragonolobus]|uniref:Uncharacterized protein n=1 Tax=Psophocarpus tetragonolobus TaxID=3891 RepID=A0AAN9SC00_PSOTE